MLGRSQHWPSPDGGRGSEWYNAERRLGNLLIQQGFTLVCNKRKRGVGIQFCDTLIQVPPPENGQIQLHAQAPWNENLRLGLPLAVLYRSAISVFLHRITIVVVIVTKSPWTTPQSAISPT